MIDCPFCGQELPHRDDFIKLDDSTGHVIVGSRATRLAPFEAKMMRCFIDNFGEIVTRDQLMTHLYTPPYPGDKIIDVRMYVLRKDLRKLDIVVDTIRKRGFRMYYEKYIGSDREREDQRR